MLSMDYTSMYAHKFYFRCPWCKLQSQSISNGGKNACDKMNIITEKGETKIYYFEANKVFKMEKKMFEQ
jgi:hypothetical protein